MTVRVNKSSFNIREKLSELERPIGLKGSELMRAETAQEARDFVSAGRKNLIINGDMRIDQRYNGSASSITNAYYSLDHWQIYEDTDGAATIQRSTTAPPGFENSLLWTTTTADSSLASAQYSMVSTNIEGYITSPLSWGTSSAKPVSLSFWVRSSLTGKFGGSIRNSAANISYVFSYTINTANTWEYKTITIPGEQGGTWVTGNGKGLQLFFSMGNGSAYSGNATGSWAAANYHGLIGETSVIGTLNATWYLTGVQLEVGKNATEFEHRSYGEELALCERYYQITEVNGLTFNIYPGTPSAYSGVNLATPMRAVPVNTYDLTFPNSGRLYYSNTNVAGTYVNGVAATYKAINVRFDRTSGTFPAGGNCGHGYVKIKSEAEL